MFSKVKKSYFKRLDVEALKAYGIKPGPIYKKIKSGENVQLDNGKMVNINNILNIYKFTASNR